MKLFQSALHTLVALGSLLVPAANVTAQVAAQVGARDPVANAAQANRVAANPVEQYTQKIEQYLRRIHANERKFLARVCTLTEDQQKQAENLEVDWKAEVAKFGVGVNVRGVALSRVQAANASTPFQLRDRFRASIWKRFSDLLTPDQQDAYKGEISARDDFRRRSEVACLMVILSKALALRPEQVQPLSNSLATWDGAGLVQLENYMHADSTPYLPNLPEALVLKHLDATQRVVFKGIKKIDFQKPWNLAELADDGLFGD